MGAMNCIGASPIAEGTLPRRAATSDAICGPAELFRRKSQLLARREKKIIDDFPARAESSHQRLDFRRERFANCLAEA